MTGHSSGHGSPDALAVFGEHSVAVVDEVPARPAAAGVGHGGAIKLQRRLVRRRRGRAVGQHQARGLLRVVDERVAQSLLNGAVARGLPVTTAREREECRGEVRQGSVGYMRETNGTACLGGGTKERHLTCKCWRWPESDVNFRPQSRHWYLGCRGGLSGRVC